MGCLACLVLEFPVAENYQLWRLHNQDCELTFYLFITTVNKRYVEIAYWLTNSTFVPGIFSITLSL
jgi:hypothetical protein